MSHFATECNTIFAIFDNKLILFVNSFYKCLYGYLLSQAGIVASAIIDEYALPNFAVTTPEGYAVRFFAQYV